VPSEVIPELPCNIAVEDEVMRGFGSLVAYLTGSIINNVLAIEVCTALNAVFEQQPAKEPNTRGCPALPYEYVDPTALTRA